MLDKICEVFTKEYKEQVKYLDFMYKHRDYFKMNCDSEDIDKIANRLKEKNFVSNFSVKINFN